MKYLSHNQGFCIGLMTATLQLITAAVLVGWFWSLMSDTKWNVFSCPLICCFRHGVHFIQKGKEFNKRTPKAEDPLLLPWIFGVIINHKTINENYLSVMQKGLRPYYIISYNKQGSFQMIIKITTMDQGLSEKIMYYGKSKICKKVHLCLHRVANLSFQSWALWLWNQN